MYAAPSLQTYLIGGDPGLFDQAIVGHGTTTFVGVNTVGTGDYISYTHGGDQLGWHTVERTEVNAEAAYLNGVLKVAGTHMSAPVPVTPFYVLANNAGSVQSPTNGGCSAAVWGAPLNSLPMYAAEYAALRSYLMSVGVP